MVYAPSARSWTSKSMIWLVILHVYMSICNSIALSIRYSHCRTIRIVFTFVKAILFTIWHIEINDHVSFSMIDLGLYLITTTCLARFTPALRRSSGCLQLPWYRIQTLASNTSSPINLTYHYKVHLGKHANQLKCFLLGQRRAKNDNILKCFRTHVGWSSCVWLWMSQLVCVDPVSAVPEIINKLEDVDNFTMNTNKDMSTHVGCWFNGHLLDIIDMFIQNIR